jgi:ribonuclease-3
MLSSVIAAHLFNKAPQGDEGYLTKMRLEQELGKDLNLIRFIDSKVPISILEKNTWKYFLNL